MCNGRANSQSPKALIGNVACDAPGAAGCLHVQINWQYSTRNKKYTKINFLTLKNIAGNQAIPEPREDTK